MQGPSLGVEDSLVGISFVTNTVEEPVSLNDLFENLYHLPSEYSRVHEVLDITDEATIISLGCEYYIGDNGINEGPFCHAFHEIDTNYQIEGGTIYINTLIVDSLDYRTDETIVSYRGFLRLNDYFGISPLRLENMDRNIPVEIRTLSNRIGEDFDSENPNFTIIVSPEDQQIDIEIFLRNIFTLADMQIPPPRGLSSIKFLSFEEARITSETAQTQRIYLSGSVPDFNLVSEGIGLQNVGLELEFTGTNRYTITFNGTTDIDSVSFNTTVTKTEEEDDYHVYMVDSQGQVISYRQLSSTLIPSISTNEISLQPDDVSAPYLTNLRITEGSLHLTDPNITMQFQPYMVYRVEGYHDADEDDVTNCFVQATYATIDGDVLVHYRYIFDYGESQQILLRAFNINQGDAAVRGIILNRLILDTYNRDFNFSQYQEYSTMNNSTTAWERGTKVSVGIDFPLT